VTLARLIPLPIHAALEVALAAVVMAVPFALGFEASALVVALVIGVLMMGTGLAAAAQISGRDGPGALRVSAHADVDLGLALASACAALIFAIGGEVGAAGLFVTVSAAQGLLAVTTRYSARA
jgi:hypothetical protein